MILTNRLFVRVAPSREAKSIYIFCEGLKREFDYFKYFKELDSRINIEIYKLHPHEDNSPTGLLAIAENCIIKSEKNPNPKYNFIEGDEVWIVLDVDKDKNESRVPKIKIVKERCENTANWHLAQSNPCFEVWLYYHFHSTQPIFDDSDKCLHWKRLVNNSIVGGFHSSRHPIFIESASENAESNFKTVEGKPDIGSTNVYELANIIIPLVSSKLEKVLKEIER
ncbi:MAG: RloB domain-containing protein [Peptostreptococcaceae bacterium]|nr:RloB domain-containing protein [Peptostreptococcaceae bacterium]